MLPETPERVDPPRVLPETARPPGDRLGREPLFPPDPRAPAGPPPAFEATPLERARDADLAPPRLAEGRPVPGAALDPPADDDGLRRRTEAEIAELRRLAAPGPGRGVDMVL